MNKLFVWLILCETDLLQIHLLIYRWNTFKLETDWVFS